MHKNTFEFNGRKEKKMNAKKKQRKKYERAKQDRK